MTEEGRLQRSVAEHVLWCEDERERLKLELVQFASGTKSVGVPCPGEIRTTGSATHILYLQRTIEQLGRVISAYSAPRG
jgi:hypothetical protein